MRQNNKENIIIITKPNKMQAGIIGKIKLGTIFLMDPTLKPTKPKPEEEEFTDAKILYFHPVQTDIHEKRKQVGISEGIVSFFLPFTDNQEPVQCISTLNFTHVMKQIEKDIWLNIVVTHPETLYGTRPTAKEEAETIANNKFQVSMFREEDSKIFYKLLDVYYKYFQLFHGSVRDLFNKYPETFEQILDDFTKNFDYHFFSKEYEKNFFWNLQFQGLFYCPIEKKQFLQTQLLVNSLLQEYQEEVQQVLVFHEEFYISSTLPHESIQPLYSYVVGSRDSQSSSKRKNKILTYKEAGKTLRVSATQRQPSVPDNDSEESKNTLFQESTSNESGQFVQISHQDLVGQDELMGISNFGKINQQALGQISNKNVMFLIGPQIDLSKKTCEIYAPRIYIKNGDQLESYKMFVYQGLKTFIVLLFKPDHQFSYKFIESLNSFLTLHVPSISQQLDQIITKVLNKEDPIRFIYFNKMNLALKLSNLVTKDVLTPELILTINQIHDSFQDDPDCLEQHMNNSFYWVVGLQSQGREIYLIFPPNYTSAKVDVEKKKILAQYFGNLFI